MGKSEAREVVPGDIAIVEEGQTIPADGKVDELSHCPRMFSKANFGRFLPSTVI